MEKKVQPKPSSFINIVEDESIKESSKDDIEIKERQMTKSPFFGRPITAKQDNVQSSLREQILQQITQQQKQTPMFNQNSRNTAASKIQLYKTETNFYKTTKNTDSLYSPKIPAFNRQSTVGKDLSTSRSISKDNTQSSKNFSKNPMNGGEIIQVFRSSGVYRKKSLVKRMANEGTKMLMMGIHFDTNRDEQQLGYEKDQIFAQKELKQQFLNSNEGEKSNRFSSEQNNTYSSTQVTKPSTSQIRSRNIGNFKHRTHNQLSNEKDNIFKLQSDHSCVQIKLPQTNSGNSLVTQSPKRTPLNEIISDSQGIIKFEQRQPSIKHSIFNVNQEGTEFKLQKYNDFYEILRNRYQSEEKSTFGEIRDHNISFASFSKQNQAPRNNSASRTSKKRTKHTHRSINNISVSIDKINKIKQAREEEKRTIQHQKHKKFNEILEEYRKSQIFEKDSFYSNVNTIIDSSEKNPNQASKRQIDYLIAGGQNSNLNDSYKVLSQYSKNFTETQSDPIEDMVFTLGENLEKLSNVIDIRKYLEQQKQIKYQGENKSISKFWKTRKMDAQQETLLKHPGMIKAQEFLRTLINKEDNKKIIKQIENIIEDVRNQKELYAQSDKLDEQAKEINVLVRQLKADKEQIHKNSSFTQLFKPGLDIDEELERRLVAMKDKRILTEEQLYLKALGISQEEWQRRKEIEEEFEHDMKDRKKLEQARKSFNKNTSKFLDYFYDEFLVQDSFVPGFEANNIFADSHYMDNIKEYLEKITVILNKKEVITIQQINQSDQIDWVSPLKCNSNKIAGSLIKSSNKFEEKQAPRAVIALYFLQRINAMGILSKIVKDNLAKVKTRRAQGGSLFGQIGIDLNKDSINYLLTYFNKNQKLKLLDYSMIDGLLNDLKFFSQFEKETRKKIYKLCQFHQCNQKGELLETNVRTTKYMYVILSGSVSIYRHNSDLQLEQHLSTLVAGESFGDLSIQKKKSVLDQYFDIDRIYAKVESQNLYYFRFLRSEFTNQVFSEMKLEMYKKIMMLQQTDFFDELSPYAFFIFASNVQVVEYKLGDVIQKQLTNPKFCYIVLEGNCRAVFDQTYEKSSQMPKALLELKQKEHQGKKVNCGAVDYQSLAELGKTQEWEKLQYELKIRQAKRQKDEERRETPVQKFSFNNQVIKEKKSNQTFIYRQHIEFGKLKEGSCFGRRALLDNQVLRRHIVDEFDKYKKVFNIGEVEEKTPEYIDIQCASEIYKEDIIRRNSTTSDGDKIFNFNPSLTVALSTSSNREDANEQAKIDQNSSVQILQFEHSYMDEDMLKSLRSQTDEFKFAQNKLNNQQECKIPQQSINEITNQLMLSQVSIVADSSVVKVMLLKKEDKKFLNENLKNIIDKKIILSEFIEFDRPKACMKEVSKEVRQNEQWNSYKQKIEDQFLIEAARLKVNKKD